MAWKNIGIIKSMKDEQFSRKILEARRDFLALRLNHEPAIKKIYLEAAHQVATKLQTLSGKTLTRNHLIALDRTLREQAEIIDASTKALMRSGIEKAVNLEAKALDDYILRAFRETNAPLDFIKLQRGFAEVNSSAAEAFWARNTKGLTISDRIWTNTDHARQAMRDVIQSGIASGRDAVTVAKDLEKYVRSGAKTLAEDYPNMMARLGRRVPKDLSYESLRLVRTEYSTSFFEGTYSRGRVNPAYRGVQYMLSDAHPKPDICDDLAEADLYGLGAGIYPEGEEPHLPHCNCLCYVVPVMIERELFVSQVGDWLEDPESQPELESWYNEFYTKIR